MDGRIALKRLSASDLTLFDFHYKKTKGTKQKAFNLDRAVFIDKFFPSLPDILHGGVNRAPLDLQIFGPGMSGLHHLQRKVIKQQKNWRLDGETIHKPDDAKSERYDILRKGDFAIFVFSGVPEYLIARMYLISSKDENDKNLHRALSDRFSAELSPRTSMVKLDPEELARIIENVSLLEGHPVIDLLIDTDALEDAAQGGIVGLHKLQRRRRSRGVSRDELERSKRNAERTGRLGEEILDTHLSIMREDGSIMDYKWESDSNAIAPYDFSMTDNNGQTHLIDAKSTCGDFTNPIHISLAELKEMSAEGVRYDLYRLYMVAESYARLRIAENVGSFAREVLETLGNLPEGVFVDAVSVNPQVLDFGPERIIDLTEEPYIE